MLVHFAFFNDFLIDVGLGLWSIRILLGLFLIKAGKIKILVSFKELLVFDIGVKVHIIELFEVTDVGSFVS